MNPTFVPTATSNKSIAKKPVVVLMAALVFHALMFQSNDNDTMLGVAVARSVPTPTPIPTTADFGFLRSAGGRRHGDLGGLIWENNEQYQKG